MNSIIGSLQIYNKHFEINRKVDLSHGYKVQVLPQEKVSKKDAYMVLLTTLKAYGFKAFESNGIVNTDYIRPRSKNINYFSNTMCSGFHETMISQIVSLNIIDVSDTINSISKLLVDMCGSKNSNTPIIELLKDSNSIIVSGSGYRVKRVLDIINILDTDDLHTKVRAIAIQYIDVKNIVAEISKIIATNEFSVHSILKTNIMPNIFTSVAWEFSYLKIILN